LQPGSHRCGQCHSFDRRSTRAKIRRRVIEMRLRLRYDRNRWTDLRQHRDQTQPCDRRLRYGLTRHVPWKLHRPRYAHIRCLSYPWLLLGQSCRHWF
jgi:hypothetical protein